MRPIFYVTFIYTVKPVLGGHSKRWPKFVSFCSGIQFDLLLTPYLCFISLLYLDLYVLGDDALISQGSFMPTKYLCVLIHIWIKGEVGAVKLVYALQ